MPSSTVLAAVVAVAFVGCDACRDDGPAVPFGLEAGGPTPEAPTIEPAAPTRGRPDGRAFEDGTRRVNLEGAPIEVEGSLRALWASDLDDDGDRDAIALVSGAPAAPVSLVFFQREGARFGAAEALSTAPAVPEGCAVTAATLSPVGESWLAARATIDCPDAPTASLEEIWVVGTDRAPRVLERLAVLSEAERAQGPFTVAFAAADHDEDGREDLVITARTGAMQIALPWLDRPSGLARDGAEPEHTLVERSREALRQLSREPADALSGSREVVAAWEALCRESGRARLRVGRTEGVSCGRSDGAGRAATTIVRALASRGELLEAIDALATLDRDGLAIDAERRDYARRAIAEAPATAGLTLRVGPPHAPPRWDAARLSALAFLDEDRVLLRRDRPRVWVLDQEETVDPPEGVDGDLRVVDPGRTWAVSGIVRRCEGHTLTVVAQQSFVAGNAFGAPRSRPLLIERAPPADAPCPELPASLASDDGGWRVLGWAPQGVVAARGSTLRVVPMTASGEPAGDPEALSPGTPPPAPLPAGAVTPDGRWLAEVRGLGVLLHRLDGHPETLVLWPEGWAEREGEISPTDVAVSPSGRRVAVLRGGRVLLLERAGN